MPKRGTNIYKRKDGRWEGRYVKTISADGTKKYGSVYGKSYAETREKQIRILQNIKSSNTSKTTPTFEELAQEWLSGIVNTVKKSTYQKYESIIKNHLYKSVIAKIKTEYITGRMIDDYASERITFVSAKTVNDILIILGMIFAYAETEYNLSKPKFHYVKEPIKVMRVLSVSEQKQLEFYLYKNMNLYKFGVILALYTGMRVGELCALQWEDITDCYIVINKTMHRIKEGNKTILEITEPKTKTSNRKIPVPEFLLPLIKNYRSTGYVLKNGNSKPVEPRLMQSAFQKMIKDCGLPKTNFHALRHTFATRCVEAGFDVKSLSEILGHNDVKTTLNKYVHSSFEQKQKNMMLLKPKIDL